jgi:3-oxoacyl-[acyl-carrier protein] reductase
MKVLDRKIALVTGATGGIGSCIARRLARDGARVVINFKSDVSKAIQISEEIIKRGGYSILLQADLSRSDEIKRLVSCIAKDFGKIDILVNNAATFSTSPIGQIDFSSSIEQFKTNVLAPSLLTQEFLPYFPSTGGGRVINMSSIAGLDPDPLMSVYSATKAALNSMTHCHAEELGLRGITVNAIAPGPTETVSNAWLTDELKQKISARTSLGRIGKAEEIAEIVAFLASNASRGITGQVIRVDGGYSRH